MRAHQEGMCGAGQRLCSRRHRFANPMLHIEIDAFPTMAHLYSKGAAVAQMARAITTQEDIRLREHPPVCGSQGKRRMRYFFLLSVPDITVAPLIIILLNSVCASIAFWAASCHEAIIVFA